MNVQVAIVGGGPAGIAAAIWCKRLNISHLMLEASQIPGGQLSSIHNPIIDYPGLITRNGSEFRQAIMKHLEQLDCNVELGAKVTSINPHTLDIEFVKNGAAATLQAQSIVLATGVTPRRLYIPGEQEMLDRGEILSASKDAERFADKIVAVVGGGDRALEGALLFAKHCSKVFLIHRSGHFRARQEYVQKVESNPKIVILKNHILEAIHGNDHVESVASRNRDTNIQKTIRVEAVLLRIGVQPNVRLMQGVVKTDADGYILTDRYGLTNIPGVFAIGDVCTSPLVSSLSHAMSQGMVSIKFIQSNILSR